MGDDAGAGNTAPTNTDNTSSEQSSNSTSQNQNDNSQNSAFDPAKVSDADFVKVFDDPRIFQHTRFKDLNDQAKKAKEYEAKEQKAKEEKLLEDKKYTELLAEKERQLADLTSKNQTSNINQRILIEAQKASVVDSDAVLQLIDRSTITLNDDGTVAGVEEAIKKLLESKPYLKGTGSQTNVEIGSPTAPGQDNNNGQVKRFKHSQIQKMTPEEYAANEKDIQAAMRAGLVEHDI